MLTVYSSKHNLHHGIELKDGVLSPSFENPQRAETVLARVHATALGDVISGRTYERTCYVAAHSERYINFLENAWQERSGLLPEGHTMPCHWCGRCATLPGIGSRSSSMANSVFTPWMPAHRLKQIPGRL
ncbi:hypothetical protein ACNGVM_004490 [Salmonella enterica]|uniref:hypothetical protein n=1 Tax=Salmonella enterica TaxID=28901 RepID=UPI0026AED0C8|nr:hypothetical protein [Salmonella enterica]EIO8636260.1 hypothetical protein [Salmonella enterica]EJG5422508.1 hypothetical protein [Salmonella enterica]EKT0973329.1 hypothetical protein [Salmonella enterica]ELC1777247.1 hypothetical protein [Salmonella enterica]